MHANVIETCALETDMNFEAEAALKCNVVKSKENILELRHERPGDINLRAVVNTSNFFADRKFGVENVSEFFCDTCGVMGKPTCQPNPTVTAPNSFRAGETIATDVCRPINVESSRSSRYVYLLFYPMSVRPNVRKHFSLFI